MRNIAIIAVLFAVVAWAGTRAKESASAPPSAATDGVNLSAVTGCRASIKLDAGTIGTGGKIIISYYDAVLGWVESDSSIHCTVVATTNDGGTRQGYVCPDLQPIAQFGRIGAHAYGVLAIDGGPGDIRTRLECFGPELP